MNLNVKFEEQNKKLNVVFSNIQQVTITDVEYYKGKYTAIPKVTEQVLETKKKYMTDDVLIKSIPTYEVSNASGGTTFYIAKE